MNDDPNKPEDQSYRASEQSGSTGGDVTRRMDDTPYIPPTSPAIPPAAPDQPQPTTQFNPPYTPNPQYQQPQQPQYQPQPNQQQYQPQQPQYQQQYQPQQPQYPAQPPQQPQYPTQPPQPQFPAQPQYTQYQTPPTTTSPSIFAGLEANPPIKETNTALLIEFFAGLFGLLGLGHILSGRPVPGLILMVSWWVILAAGFGLFTVVAVFTLGLGCLCLPVFWLAGPAASTYWLYTELNKRRRPTVM